MQDTPHISVGCLSGQIPPQQGRTSTDKAIEDMEAS